MNREIDEAELLLYTCDTVSHHSAFSPTKFEYQTRHSSTPGAILRLGRGEHNPLWFATRQKLRLIRVGVVEEDARETKT